MGARSAGGAVGLLENRRLVRARYGHEHEREPEKPVGLRPGACGAVSGISAARSMHAGSVYAGSVIGVLSRGGNLRRTTCMTSDSGAPRDRSLRSFRKGAAAQHGPGGGGAAARESVVAVCLQWGSGRCEEANKDGAFEWERAAAASPREKVRQGQLAARRARRDMSPSSKFELEGAFMTVRTCLLVR